MTGGEIAAQAMIDATIRLLPGVIGNQDSLKSESHSNGLLEHDQFTRPDDWMGHKVPAILTSGDHGKIEDWRENQSKSNTKQYRVDMWRKIRPEKNND
jgi:tRNA (guanine37-N1)-methyltransferase